MVIDNTALIRSLLEFPPKSSDGCLRDNMYADQKLDRDRNSRSLTIDMRDCFYVVQLLQRQKDNPAVQFQNPNLRNNSNRAIQQYQIYSLDDWDLKIDNIIKAAKLYQARVYIDLNLKDSKDVFANLMKNMSERFATGNFTKLHRIYNEAVGETNRMKGTRKSWLVDIDTKDNNVVQEMTAFIKTLIGGGNKGYGDVYATVPTKNGYHLITTSFDSMSFNKQYPDVDVHKHNPTIAWMETDWRTANA